MGRDGDQEAARASDPTIRPSARIGARLTAWASRARRLLPKADVTGRVVVRTGIGVIAAAAVGAATLLIVTPSVGDAEMRSRSWISVHHAGPRLTALPPRVASSVLAAEDHRFYQHHGLDVRALGRAAGGALTGRDAGGSTIEVQLAKLLYTGGRHGLIDQAEQAALAVKLDRSYTKTQILLMYLDTEYFGHGFYGVTAAARGYFDAAPQDLTWGQAALLAGLLKAPSYDDPLRHPDRALVRRGEVVDRLRAVGVLTAAQAAAVDRAALLTVPQPRPGAPVR